jgi:hypothetical protein
VAGGERLKATLVAAAAEKHVEKKEAMAAAEKKESLVYSLFGLGLWCVSGLVVREWAGWATKQKPNLCFLPCFFSILYLLNKNVNDLYRLAKRLGVLRHA